MQQGRPARPPATSMPQSSAVLPGDSSGQTDPPHAIRTWLAGAHDLPAQARTEWAAHRVALLSLGRRFAAVRIPGVIIHAAVGTDDRQAVADTVGAQVRGPVIHDVCAVGPTYWALVPWHPGSHWSGTTEISYLGPVTYLGVPDLGCTEPPGPYWVTPPRHCRDLCHPETVLDLIVRGGHRLRHEPP
ncbi:hypothetical protein [Streptomyces nogalater]|uniref:Uncharacterized protein n=1 Tax=Streptomyces nogalater TaxID=38314 RepID=A0ABW0WR27_STRNO